MLCTNRSACWCIRSSVSSDFDHKTHSVNMQKKTHTWMIKSCGLLSCNKPKKHPAQTEHGSLLLLSWLQWLLLASVECVERQTSLSGILFTYKIGNGAIKTCGQASSHTGNSERAHPTQVASRSPESAWVFSEAWSRFFHVSVISSTYKGCTAQIQCSLRTAHGPWGVLLTLLFVKFFFLIMFSSIVYFC